MTVLRLLAASTLMLATPTLAADLDVFVEAPLVIDDSAHDWTGFYAGINAGYGGGTFEHPLELGGDFEEESAIGSLDITAGGFVGGVQAGYNMQMDGFFVGLEADLQGSTIDGRISLSIESDGDTFEADAGTRLDWFATLRPRLGFVNDRFVVYGTGGLAFGQTTSSVALALNGNPAIDEEVENDRFGWTVGAGIEYALMDNLTFKTEYLYTDLGTENLIAFEDEGFGATLDSTVAFHTVRAGLNLQF